MKIIRIEIYGLFGIFDHTLPLNRDADVTIMIGENGIGKTRILEAVHAIFVQNFQYLCDLEFATLRLLFDNRTAWSITRKHSGDRTTIYGSRTEANSPNSKVKTEKLFEFQRHAKKSSRSAKTMHQLYLEEKYLEELHYRNRLEYMHEVSSKAVRDSFLRWAELKEDIKPPGWFKEAVENVKVRLIETQRILSPKAGKTESYGSTVENCAQELKEKISLAIKASADISSGLDSTYPNRLVDKLQANHGINVTYAKLNESLETLDERRKGLSAAGLVVDDLNRDLVKIGDNQGPIFQVMELYIADSHKKLEPYKELAEKINLFMRIINKRFKHKKLVISKERGIIFKSTKIAKGDEFMEIDATDLSSGEQHELVLFYKLIFNSSVNDLVMVDEPELSLHISWQNQFINDLKEVASLNGFSALIATHSPDIISDNWELKVELSGVE